jgi:hypothetical protein
VGRDSCRTGEWLLPLHSPWNQTLHPPWTQTTTVSPKTRVVDPDPDWIRIQWLCGSGSVLGIWIPDPDPGAITINFNGKMNFLFIFLKNFTTKKV